MSKNNNKGSDDKDAATDNRQPPQNPVALEEHDGDMAAAPSHQHSRRGQESEHDHDDDDDDSHNNNVIVDITASTNNDNDTAVRMQPQDITQRYYVQQAPNWTSRRRRQASLATCATDVAQRLHAAATLLLERLQRYTLIVGNDSSLKGLTLPVTAWAWLFMWNDSADIVASNPFLQPFRAQRRTWQALAHFVTTRLQQVRVIRDPWPAPRQSRNKAWQPTWDNSEEAAAAWLQAHYAWQTRPCLNVQDHLPQELHFLWMDGVPPEFVVPHCRVRVWRVQNCAASTLARLLGTLPIRTTETTTRTSVMSEILFPVFEQLTHLKLERTELTTLTHCGQPLLPVTCPQLQSLHLPHNLLTDQAISNAGLDQMVYLHDICLAHNQLRGTWQCGTLHWTRLDVSHNQIRTIGRGLLQLYALVHLNLSYNRLEQLSRVARLARLPLLQELQLHGNPVTRIRNELQPQTRRPSHRIAVLRKQPLQSPALYQQVLWDLFREARHGDEHDLPRLDGRTVAPCRSGDSGPQATTSPTRPPVPVPVVRICPQGRPTVENHTPRTGTMMFQSAATQPLILAKTSTRENEAFPKMGRTVDFDTWKVLESLPTSICVEQHDHPEEEPVCEEPTASPESNGKEVSVGAMGATAETIDSATKADTVKTTETVEGSTDNESPTSSGLIDENMTENCRPSMEVHCAETTETVTNKATSTDESEDKGQSESALTSPNVVDHASETSIIEQFEPNNEIKENGSVVQSNQSVDISSKVDETEGSAAKSSQSTNNAQEPETAKASDADTNVSIEKPSPIHPRPPNTMPDSTKWPVSPVRKQLSVQPSVSSVSASASEPRTLVKTPSSLGFASLSPNRNMDPSPSSMASPPGSSFHVAFPDHVWQDETNSVAQSSTALSYPDTAASENEEVKLYELAESKSSFVGPQTYKALTIRDNLELYFRLFVFSQALPSISSFLDSSVEGDWLSILELYPRIQLWPIDRRLRDATTPDLELRNTAPTETFSRVWMENVVACGKPALRRLTPNLTARLGFHGELMWSSNAVHLKQEAVSTHRQVILCLSSLAFYVILDHDAVTEKAKNQKRRFPLPLPMDACFAEAKWPHALARHPFSMLRKVIIGFGFQRLTLRFSNSSYPSPEDFTYVLMTCNKMNTVSILKDIQEIAFEAKNSCGFDQLAIENDDFQVLEALGQAVAPDVIGIVLHYQILEQRWKHGDRPNVRRIFLVTDTNVYLLDEDYLGDGAKKDTIMNVLPEQLGLPRYRLVDSALLSQIGQLHTGTDPTMITLVIRPHTRLTRTRNWRLVCRDREGKERLVDDVRKAIGGSA